MSLTNITPHSTLRAQKETVINEIEKLRKELNAFDLQGDGDEDKYSLFQKELDSLKTKLESLRLLSDTFVVSDSNSKRYVLEISERGDITILNTLIQTEPVIPFEISSKYEYCKVNVVQKNDDTTIEKVVDEWGFEKLSNNNSGNESDSTTSTPTPTPSQPNVLFEVQYADKARYIDEMKLIRLINVPSQQQPPTQFNLPNLPQISFSPLPILTNSLFKVKGAITSFVNPLTTSTSSPTLTQTNTPTPTKTTTTTTPTTPTTPTTTTTTTTTNRPALGLRNPEVVSFGFGSHRSKTPTHDIETPQKQNDTSPSMRRSSTFTNLQNPSVKNNNNNNNNNSNSSTNAPIEIPVLDRIRSKSLLARISSLPNISSVFTQNRNNNNSKNNNNNNGNVTNSSNNDTSDQTNSSVTDKTTTNNIAQNSDIETEVTNIEPSDVNSSEIEIEIEDIMDSQDVETSLTKSETESFSSSNVNSKSPNDFSTDAHKAASSSMPSFSSIINSNENPSSTKTGNEMLVKNFTHGLTIQWNDGSSRLFFSLEADEIVEVFGSHMNRYKKSRFAHIARFKELHQMKSTAYDSNTEAHEEKLLNFWKLIFPETLLESRRGGQWKILGFQGNDPATDFRGMGLLGLYNLIYFAEKYTNRIRELVSFSREYPFAVAGINITKLLIDLLKIKATNMSLSPSSPEWDSPLLLFFCSSNTPESVQNTPGLPPHSFCFEELYCVMFDILDAVWVKMNAGYMDFPKVLEQVKTLISRVATSRPQGWLDFRNRIDQLVISYTLEDNIPT